MYWDQWGFYAPLFDGEGIWETFIQQHGPHRQGLGLLITRFIADVSNWNSRWDAFGSSFFLIGASLIALGVAVQCGRRTSLALPVMALVFFNLRQYEDFVGAANLSHGAVPMFLFMLYCLSVFVKAPAIRLILMGGLTALLIFTGFGLFAGLLTPILGIIEAIHAFKNRQWRHATWVLAMLAFTAVSWSVFLQGYVFTPAVDGFRFPYEHPLEYVYFVGLMLANFHGLPGYHLYTIAGGLLLVAVLVLLAAYHGWKILRQGINDNRSSVVIFCLSGYALLYCFNTAIGRICLGLAIGPSASRYVTLMIPAGLGIYLGLTDAFPRKAWAVSALYIALLCAGTLVLRPSDWLNIYWYHDGRVAWKTTYLETHDELQANERSNFKIFPDFSVIKNRMNYLKQHQLNLFTPENPSAPRLEDDRPPIQRL